MYLVIIATREIIENFGSIDGAIAICKHRGLAGKLVGESSGVAKFEIAPDGTLTRCAGWYC